MKTDFLPLQKDVHKNKADNNDSKEQAPHKGGQIPQVTPNFEVQMNASVPYTMTAQ